MEALPGASDPAEIRQWIKAGNEIALVDVREQRQYGEQHIVPAVNVPLSRLELMLPTLVPGLKTGIVFYDDGEGLAERAIRAASTMGYSNLSMLEGGLEAWKRQGYPSYDGTHVIGAALAELIYRNRSFGLLTPDELVQMQDEGVKAVILDSRPWHDYMASHIPGGIHCHLGELVYRVKSLLNDETTAVIVNCAGRTRSILGAQSLIEAGLPNPVYSLVEGTYGWWRSGRELVAGEGPRADQISGVDDQWAKEASRRLANEAGLLEIDSVGFSKWQQERRYHSVYFLDLRSPEEYLDGHVASAINAHGGQLIECSEDWIGAAGARILLLDDDGVRARVVGCWLKKLGYDQVAVLADSIMPALTERGARNPLLDWLSVPAASASELDINTVVIDVSPSADFRKSHIPGALWLMRSRIDSVLEQIPRKKIVVMDEEHGNLARLVATDLLDSGRVDVAVLEGGLVAWVASGGELETGESGMLMPGDDVYYPQPESLDEKMAMKKDYMNWQVGLDRKLIEDDIIPGGFFRDFGSDLSAGTCR